MHETAIAKNVIEEAQKHGEVVGVKLEIGELAHVPGSELVETLKRLKPNWNFEWEEKPARARCSCGFFGHPDVLERGHDHFLIECPQCSEVPDLLEGTDVKIISVKVS